MTYYATGFDQANGALALPGWTNTPSRSSVLVSNAKVLADISLRFSQANGLGLIPTWQIVKCNFSMAPSTPVTTNNKLYLTAGMAVGGNGYAVSLTGTGAVNFHTMSGGSLVNTQPVGSVNPSVFDQADLMFSYRNNALTTWINGICFGPFPIPSTWASITPGDGAGLGIQCDTGKVVSIDDFEVYDENPTVQFNPNDVPYYDYGD